jgi:hypothetical protein
MSKYDKYFFRHVKHPSNVDAAKACANITYLSTLEVKATANYDERLECGGGH